MTTSVLVTGGGRTRRQPRGEGSAAFEDLDVIVETARRWRDAHPSGYRKATA